MDYGKMMRAHMERFQERVARQVELYEEVSKMWKNSECPIIHLDKTYYFNEIIELFGPCLSKNKIEADLSLIFRASFHPSSGSVIVSNRGSIFLAQAPFSKKYFIICHIGATVYHPQIGIESINIGIVGNIYESEVILRSESACPPSFLFGSQGCNCCYQWMSMRELAASFNPIEPPALNDPEELEHWIEQQFDIKDNRCIPKTLGPGFLMLHFDSQSGMGSGWTEGEFCYDLFSRALLRQLGENSVKQIYHTSIKEGYKVLGLPSDGRKEAHGAGYRLIPIVLDFLEVNKNLIFLSNNQQKLHFLAQSGYVCRRIKSLGQVLQAGIRVANQRREDFFHQDIGKEIILFEDELERLKKEIYSLK